MIKAKDGCWSCWLEDHANGKAFKTSDSACVQQCKAYLQTMGFAAQQQHDAHEFLARLRDRLQHEAAAAAAAEAAATAAFATSNLETNEH
jgi:hypothetical protein